MQSKTFMQDFLKQHDFIYEKPSPNWYNGLPLGNASIGAMVWGDGKPLIMTLERTDLWALRRKPIDWSTYNYANLKNLLGEADPRLPEQNRRIYDTFGNRFNEEMYNKGVTQTRLAPGRIEIEWRGDVIEHTSRLDLFQAQALGKVALSNGEASGKGEYRIFVDASRDVIVAEVTARDGAEISCISSRGPKEKFHNLGFPEPEEGKTGDTCWRLQKQTYHDGVCDGEFAVAWRIEKTPVKGQVKVEKQIVYCCIVGSREVGKALPEAIRQAEEAASLGAAQLFKEHCEWWADYWTKSFITIPDPHIENLYYAELYKLGCQMRQGKPYLSGQGMWSPDDSFPPWAAQYGFNLNEQIDTWPTLTSNHIDEVKSLSELLWRWLPVNQELCKKFYGVDGAMLIHGSDFDGYEVPGWYCANLWAGCGPWACWTLWQIYLYTMDEEFLRLRAYPLMREHMRQYFGILEKWDDGKYHIPRNPSPEWLNNDAAAWGRDDAGNHGIIRGMAKALIEAENILQIPERDDSWISAPDCKIIDLADLQEIIPHESRELDAKKIVDSILLPLAQGTLSAALINTEKASILLRYAKAGTVVEVRDSSGTLLKKIAARLRTMAGLGKPESRGLKKGKLRLVMSDKKAFNLAVHSIPKAKGTWLHIAPTPSKSFEPPHGDSLFWREILDNLAPYPTDPQSGLQLMKDVPLTDSHRTFPQLLGIYPFRDINKEGSDEDRKLIYRSFWQVDNRGFGNWCGYTVSWMAAITAGVGDAGRAHQMLRRYVECCTSENSFHVNGDARIKGLMGSYYMVPTPEGGFGAAGAVLEMLLQSWNNLIRIFPATPEWWPDAAFDNLRAEGAFLVSARKRKGAVTWVRIESEAGKPCRIRNPFGAPADLKEESTGKEITLEGDFLEFATMPGGRYTLNRVGSRHSSALPRFRRDADTTNWFGLKRLARF